MGDARIVFDHIAIAMERMADAPPVLAGALGGVPDGGAPSHAFNWGCWRFEGGGRIEIIEPRGEDGFVRRFLARHGPGIHHVTFKVPSLRRACDRAEAFGYKVVGRDESNPDWKEAFLHPKQALGIVVQLAEAAGGSPWLWKPPAGPPNPPPPVTILGLRLRAHSPELARVQWESVLEGECTDGPGELVYRWPGSPMRVAVEIDPTREPGPIAIEFAGRGVFPQDGRRQAVLGAVFSQRSS